MSDLEKAVHATLLFHSASPWDAEKRELWLQVTGEAEATTKVLCDTARRGLRSIGYEV